MTGCTPREEEIRERDRQLRESAGCTCPASGPGAIVTTLEQTLACPLAWEELPGQGWRHVTPARKRVHAAPRTAA